MVEDLRSAFDDLLDENTWLTADDLADSKEKLAAIEQHVACVNQEIVRERRQLGVNGRAVP